MILLERHLRGPGWHHRSCNGVLLDIDGDGISDYDEVDPHRSGASQAVKDFVALYGDKTH